MAEAPIVDLDGFLKEQMAIAVALPEQVKFTFDQSDLPLTKALDIIASIKKSADCLDAVLSSIEKNTLDEPRLRSLTTLQSIWREMYVLAQVGTDRLMVQEPTKLAS